MRPAAAGTRRVSGEWLNPILRSNCSIGIGLANNHP